VGNEPRFRSRYGDPNHLTNNGGPISLISGGKISRPSKDIRGYINDRKGRRRCRRGSSSSSGSSDDNKSRAKDKARRPGLISSVKGSIVGPGGEDQGLIKGIKSRTMKTDILYLMIVNKPTDREIDTADTTFTPPSPSQTTLRTSPPQPTQAIQVWDENGRMVGAEDFSPSPFHPPNSPPSPPQRGNGSISAVVETRNTPLGQGESTRTVDRYPYVVWSKRREPPATFRVECIIRKIDRQSTPWLYLLPCGS
jgi:hypothetical protein